MALDLWVGVLPSRHASRVRSCVRPIDYRRSTIGDVIRFPRGKEMFGAGDCRLTLERPYGPSFRGPRELETDVMRRGCNRSRPLLIPSMRGDGELHDT